MREWLRNRVALPWRSPVHTVGTSVGSDDEHDSRDLLLLLRSGHLVIWTPRAVPADCLDSRASTGLLEAARPAKALVTLTALRL
jgi:hypothetical protein